MIRSTPQTFAARRAFGTGLLALCAMLAAPRQASAARPEFNGSYDVYVKGDWVGTGQITIGNTNVNFKITVTDDAGNVHSLHCPGLDLDDAGRFTGQGDVDGNPVKITGRVDDALGKGTPRILGTVLDPADHVFARFVGSRKKDAGN